MTGVAKWFTITAVLYGLLGLLLGLNMAMSHNHGQMPTHAHVMVVGWLSFFAFGVFYHLFQDTAQGWAAKLHLLVAEISLAALVVGLWLLYSGKPQFEPLAAISALVYAASFLLFAVIALSAVARKPA